MEGSAVLPIPEVLIVDDLDRNRIALRETLHAPDRMKLFEAASGEEALELALEHDFALILLDVQMPDMDGYETAELLRGSKKTKQIPIIFVTAINKEKEHVFTGYAVGAVDYLFKPVDPLLLKAKVDNFLELYRSRQYLNHYVTRLEEANEELDRFAYTVSHDLKAPLRAVKQLSEFIVEDLGEEVNDEVKGHMTLMKSRIERMERMIGDILSYARAGSENTAQEIVDTQKLVESIRDMIGVPTGFEITIASPMPVMQTAEAPLKQVLANLITNAVAHHDKDQGVIEISCREGEAHFEFHVIDDGPGIAEADHEKIFEMLKTLRSRDEKGSSGIGLSIVKKLVEAAGGWVEVRSVEGQGAEFVVYWPRAYGVRLGSVDDSIVRV